ncbi:MAG: hypothetical protein AB1631_20630 [Acidobacteriota bacterium]
MTDAQKKALFDKLVREIMRDIHSHERRSIERALKLLNELRRDVIVLMAESGASQFTMSVYRQIKAAIEYRIDDFERELTTSFNKNLSRAFDLGTEMVEKPSIEALQTPIIGISRQPVQVAAAFSAELISSLSIATKEAINRVLRRAVLGVLPISDAIKSVGRSLTSAGPFKSLALRAETIVRTEVLRIFSIAAHARMQASAKAAQDLGWVLLREWSTAKDRRVRGNKSSDQFSHILAHGQFRRVDQPFDIPILLKGIPTGFEQLSYPRDPKGSAANTINCRCAALPRIFRASEAERVLAQSLLAA